MKELIERLRSEWTARTARERQILSAGAVVLLAIAAWAGVWQPVRELHQRRASDLEIARDIAVQLETIAAEGRGKTGEPRGTSSNRSLLSVVDRSSKRSQVDKEPTRIQPDGEAVRVWFEDVPFDQLLRWLSDLSSLEGVEVSEANFERQPGSGLVNARLTLVRP